MVGPWWWAGRSGVSFLSSSGATDILLPALFFLQAALIAQEPVALPPASAWCLGPVQEMLSICAEDEGPQRCQPGLSSGDWFSPGRPDVAQEEGKGQGRRLPPAKELWCWTSRRGAGTRPPPPGP